MGFSLVTAVPDPISDKTLFLTREVETLSPEGGLLQVEYAIEAIKPGLTASGLKVKEAIVLVVEKRITSSLLGPSNVEKITEIVDHIGCAMSVLIADAHTLVEHARVETHNHRFSYGEPITVESTTQALCERALGFAERDEEFMSRPFGVSLLTAGYDEIGPCLKNKELYQKSMSVLPFQAIEMDNTKCKICQEYPCTCQFLELTELQVADFRKENKEAKIEEYLALVEEMTFCK